MAFLVEIERRTTIRQGLPSPIRADRGLPLIPAGQGVTLVLKIGVAFDEGQLTEHGWFFDADAAAELVQECCDGLSGHSWTELFPFRPTFELVARHLYHQLADVTSCDRGGRDESRRTQFGYRRGTSSTASSCRLVPTIPARRRLRHLPMSFVPREGLPLR